MGFFGMQQQNTFLFCPHSGDSAIPSSVVNYMYDVEKALPYKYSIFLEEIGVDAFFAPSKHGGIYEVISGEMRFKKQMYFFLDTNPQPNESKQNNDRSITFSFSKGTKVVKFRYAMSFQNIALANKHATEELYSWDWKSVSEIAKAEWNKILGHVKVEGGNFDDQQLFYTALYRTYDDLIDESECNDGEKNEDELITSVDDIAGSNRFDTSNGGSNDNTEDSSIEGDRKIEEWRLHHLRGLIDRSTERKVIKGMLADVEKAKDKWEMQQANGDEEKEEIEKEMNDLITRSRGWTEAVWTYLKSEGNNKKEEADRNEEKDIPIERAVELMAWLSDMKKHGMQRGDANGNEINGIKTRWSELSQKMELSREIEKRVEQSNSNAKGENAAEDDEAWREEEAELMKLSEVEEAMQMLIDEDNLLEMSRALLSYSKANEINDKQTSELNEAKSKKMSNAMNSAKGVLRNEKEVRSFEESLVSVVKNGKALIGEDVRRMVQTEKQKAEAKAKANVNAKANGEQKEQKEQKEQGNGATQTFSLKPSFFFNDKRELRKQQMFNTLRLLSNSNITKFAPLLFGSAAELSEEVMALINNPPLDPMLPFFFEEEWRRQWVSEEELREKRRKQANEMGFPVNEAEKAEKREERRDTYRPLYSPKGGQIGYDAQHKVIPLVFASLLDLPETMFSSAERKGKENASSSSSSSSSSDSSSSSSSSSSSFLFSRLAAQSQRQLRRRLRRTYRNDLMGLWSSYNSPSVFAPCVSTLIGLGEKGRERGAVDMDITAPLFEKVTITFEEGSRNEQQNTNENSKKRENASTFVIAAQNLKDRTNHYIQSVSVNEQNWTQPTIDTSLMKKGGNMTVVLGPHPNNGWQGV
ncbi:putative alpha-1 2-mannosidase [Monocercomonoides exilis]|uniref:putative alpha-1 2-mannosidase n=1 Tax=Monocercomonoides exilis TaxID=2049356 RepID=UPI0035598120|nr:putative alpha-1 2-mannosidase [Monocercomonoides exilis]|eukprot:MONOS_4750.1-p1 / transcript=MONOS_4750.1 / gene=MONOS_4750 / organism=Monocercomonoides_exilis_PA203 / gene_product=alpha-1 2-mannosidase / transcript_product=alpha-1 2-mannosidase / location=Mono_scaffold00130:89591-92269(+) / protein_length=867 / sequence_SO=supercontig / SO=protein_coding / is_pseudo=false